jgi:hypothetical protein
MNEKSSSIHPIVSSPPDKAMKPTEQGMCCLGLFETTQ